VHRADTSSAILLRVKPSLKPFLIPDAGESAIPSFTSRGLKERLLLLTKSSDLSEKIISIWLRLRYLTQLLASLPDTKTTIDDIFFTDKLDFIERNTISLLHDDSLAESGAVDFLTAFLNASFIYIYEELRECPRWTNVCVFSSQRICSTLQVANLSSVTRLCPDLLLWTLLLGRSGNSPFGESGRQWFSKEIANMEDNFDTKVPTTAVRGLKYFELAEETASHVTRKVVTIDTKGNVGGEAG
jgi:hypothetical protein